jgi:hypothetical protein
MSTSLCEIEKYAWLHNSRRTAAMVSETRSLRFGIPGGAAPVELPGREQLLRGQRDEGIQRQQARRGARNRLARPLPLGLDAQMRTRFLERDLYQRGQAFALEARASALAGAALGRWRIQRGIQTQAGD